MAASTVRPSSAVNEVNSRSPGPSRSGVTPPSSDLIRRAPGKRPPVGKSLTRIGSPSRTTSARVAHGGRFLRQDAQDCLAPRWRFRLGSPYRPGSRLWWRRGLRGALPEISCQSAAMPAARASLSSKLDATPFPAFAPSRPSERASSSTTTERASMPAVSPCSKAPSRSRPFHARYRGIGARSSPPRFGQRHAEACPSLRSKCKAHGRPRRHPRRARIARPLRCGDCRCPNPRPASARRLGVSHSTSGMSEASTASPVRKRSRVKAG